MDKNQCKKCREKQSDQESLAMTSLPKKIKGDTANVRPIFKSSRSIDEKNEVNNLDVINIRQGRWLTQEHIRFVKGCLLYGNNWKKVKDCVKTRSSAQIRSHAQKYLIKLCKKYKNHPQYSSQYCKTSSFSLKEDQYYQSIF